MAEYRFYGGRILRNVSEIRDSFGRAFPNFLLGYSFKTNSHPFVIDEVRKSGALAEVVSAEEYEAAVRHGFSPSEIIFNGVCKDENLLVQCALSGGFVNLDNEEDVDCCLRHFESCGSPLAVGLRLNFDVGNKIRSRFGIDVDSELYRKVVRLDREGAVKVRGLSCHFTSSRENMFWRRKAQVLAERSSDFSSDIEYFDFGGSLAASWEKPDVRKNLRNGAAASGACGKGGIDFASIRDAILDVLGAFHLEDRTVIIESGTAVVSSAFDGVAEVLHLKEGFAILDVSFFDFLLGSMNDNLSFDVVHHGAGQRVLRNCVLSGYTCLENDILKKGFNGRLGVGDEIVFRNVGAYSICFSNRFIRNPLPVVPFP